MKKGGTSHIETILSFVIFMAVLTFALYFFSPSDSTRLVDSSLTYGFREIERNTSVDVEIFSISVVGTGGNSVIGFGVAGIPTEKKSRVEDINGNVVGSWRDADVVYFNVSSMENFYNVELNEEFVESPLANGVFDENYYEIASSEKKEVISEKKFAELGAFYDADYNSLKKMFNLPNRVQIGFSLEFADGSSINAEREIPDGFEVFSDKRRAEILRRSGEREFGELNVWVW